jgi:hypothetical protein
MRTKYEADDEADSCLDVRHRPVVSKVRATYIRPSCHPSSLHAVSQLETVQCASGSLHTLVKSGRPMRPLGH